MKNIMSSARGRKTANNDADQATNEGVKKEESKGGMNANLPTSYIEMFKFNAAVMGFGQNLWQVTGFLHPSDEVVKEAEAAAVESEAVNFPEVDADRKHEATLRDVVAEEVLVPAVGAPQTGWRVDRFPRGPGRVPDGRRQGCPEGDEGEVAC